MKRKGTLQGCKEVIRFLKKEKEVRDKIIQKMKDSKSRMELYINSFDILRHTLIKEGISVADFLSITIEDLNEDRSQSITYKKLDYVFRKAGVFNKDRVEEELSMEEKIDQIYRVLVPLLKLDTTEKKSSWEK